MHHVDDLLGEYALGLLPEEQAAEVDHHVQGCARCLAELAAYSDAAAALALSLDPISPSPAVRERLLASVGGSRFDRFVVRLSDLLDLGVERVRSLLASTEDPGAWEALLPGVAVMHLPYGPGVVAADVGFVRVAAGLPFPYHKHLGEEHVLVLGGAFRDDDGRVLRAGDEDHKPAGSAHAFQVLEGEELLYLVILAGGVEFPPSPV